MTDTFRWVGVALLTFAGAGMAAETPVTFAKDVAPIFQEKCQDRPHQGVVRQHHGAQGQSRPGAMDRFGRPHGG